MVKAHSLARPVAGTLLLLLLSIAAPGAVPAARPVVLVVEENHSYESVIGSPSMPFLNRLARQYAVATKYYANDHSSIPNYFWMTAGQPLTYNDNTRAIFDVNNIVRQMLIGGKSWKSYAEGLPYAGYTGFNTELYVKRHNPLAYFTDVANSSLKSNLAPFSEFAADLRNNRLPDFSFVVPNIQHDAHNGSLSTADRWLANNIAPLLSTPDFQPGGRGVLIITFDESNDEDCRPVSCEYGKEGGGRVATVIAGPAVRRQFASQAFYRHENLLRTIAVMLGLRDFPGAAARARSMSDFF